MSKEFDKVVDDFFKNYQDRGMKKWKTSIMHDCLNESKRPGTCLVFLVSYYLNDLRYPAALAAASDGKYTAFELLI